MKNKRRFILLVIAIVIILIVGFLGIGKNKILRIIYPKTYREFVSLYSEEYGVDENLIFAVIKAESNFDDEAVSHKEAIRFNADYGRDST